MISIPSNRSVFFDVDDTIIMWNATDEQKFLHGVQFKCPGGLICVDGELVHSPAWEELLVPHRLHIEQLKKHKMRGHTVVVWSAGGYDWAETVVRTLRLEKYVDLVICKPTWIYDDTQPQDFMPKPQWKEDK